MEFLPVAVLAIVVAAFKFGLIALLFGVLKTFWERMSGLRKA